jgi:hypothetical protein
MTWDQVGWGMIALAVVLLIGFNLIFKAGRRYHVRQLPAIKALFDQRVIAVERGEGRQVVLGHRFWGRAYPGLGLHALSVLPSLVSPEMMVDGGQAVSAGAGELVLFARQIIQGNYREGFSTGLEQSLSPIQLPGPTPLSFTVGLLTEINLQSPGSLALFGSFGQSAPLWAEAAFLKGGNVFAAAGLISAQAALFLSVRDLLIGEEIFLLPGMMESTTVNQAGWISEDILRALLIVLILVAAVMKMVGLI